MQGLELFLHFIRKFDKLKIHYMVIGSVATILYGEPRLTHDIDLVILTADFDINEFLTSFPLEDYYCPPEEALKEELSRKSRGHFNLIHHESGFKADIYIADDSPFYRWAFSNINEISLGEEIIKVAPAEYVLVGKLSYYKEGGSFKHLEDNKGMLSNPELKIDWEIVNSEAKIGDLAKNLSLSGKNN